MSDAALLQLREVDVRVGNGDWLLKPTTMAVDAGDWVFVTGRSGVGKSVLLQAIMAVLPPTFAVRGRMLFDNVPIDRRHRGRDIGWMPQLCGASLHPLQRLRSQLDAPRQWHRLPPRSDEQQTQRQGLLERLGVLPLLDRHPHQLSAGQQQRALFAQVVAAGPRLLLLDEPTAALDDDNRDVLLAELEHLQAAGVAIVMVSHDLRLWPRAQRSWLIDDGVVVEDQWQQPTSALGKRLRDASS